MIVVNSEGWPADIEVRVALLELGADIGLAEDVPNAMAIVPPDGRVEIVFTFPDNQRWLSQSAVQVILHDPHWRLRGPAIFTLVPP